MRGEREKYISGFTSELLVPFNWEDVVRTGEPIPPDTLSKVLTEAQEVLLSTPGPNWDRRVREVPHWFNFWITLCEQNISMKYIDVRKVYPFEKIPDKLNENQLSDSGILMMAGGEGHAGHRAAANIISGKVRQVVFAFEGPEYLDKNKDRGGFLPLEVRLSMWNMHPDIHLITVLPPKPQGANTNDHYELLFEQSGATMQFVEVKDPFVRLKALRRKDGVPDGFNVYQHEFGEVRTSKLVERLADEVNHNDLIGRSIEDSIFEL